ncbi:MAG: hypothetical protein IJ410_06610 [Oscillospiraceae bacterium]|nr:hypothetical protein [Oscillospiraceae bacterium]
MNEEEMRAIAEMSTGWHVLTPFPVQPEQMEIIGQAIKTMRQGYMDYVTVELLAFQGDIDFIQTATTEPGYRVELKLTAEDTKMFALDLKTADEVVELFRTVLTKGETPDLSLWEDITRRVFYPQLDWEEEAQEETPVWPKKLQ